MLAIYIAVTFTSFAQVNIEDLVRPGTKLVYAVESRGMKYDFIVTVKQLTPVVVFNWEMTEPANISGTIIHTEKGMQSARTMFNFFRPGEKTLDDETSCVWLSNEVYTGMYHKDGTGISTDVGAPQRTFTKTNDDSLKVTVNGKKQILIESMAIEVGNSGKSNNEDFFTFSSSSKMPIIYKFKGSFYIELRAINN